MSKLLDHCFLNSNMNLEPVSQQQKWEKSIPYSMSFVLPHLSQSAGYLWKSARRGFTKRTKCIDHSRCLCWCHLEVVVKSYVLASLHTVSLSMMTTICHQHLLLASWNFIGTPTCHLILKLQTGQPLGNQVRIGFTWHNASYCCQTYFFFSSYMFRGPQWLDFVNSILIWSGALLSLDKNWLQTRY